MTLFIAAMTEQALVNLCRIRQDSKERLADDAILYVSRSTGKIPPARITVADLANLLLATTGHTLDCLLYQYDTERLDAPDCICKKEENDG